MEAGSSKRTKEEVIAALRETKGAVYIAAENLGVSAASIFRYVKKWKEVEAILGEERGKVIDKAENKLLAAIEAGEGWAIAFCLKTIGRNRGYAEKIDIEFVDAKISRLLAGLAGRGEIVAPEPPGEDGGRDADPGGRDDGAGPDGA